MTECSPTLPKYRCGILTVVIYFRKIARLNVDPEKTDREKARH